MGFQHVMPWKAQGGPAFLPIQSGVIALDEPDLFVIVNIAAVNLSKAVLEFTRNGDNNQVNPLDVWISGQISSPTTIIFQRMGSTASIPVNISINWFVWQASPSNPMIVHRGSIEIGNFLPLPVNLTIPAVDLAHSFPIITSRSEKTSFPNDVNGTRAVLTSPTNLELLKLRNQPLTPLSHIVEYQVIENPNWDVQQINISMPGVTLNQTITAIPPAQSFFAASGVYFLFTSITGQDIPIFRQTSPTNVYFVRGSAVRAWNSISLYCINTNGDFNTQHISGIILSAQTIHQFAVAPIDLTKSFIKLNSVLNSQYSSNPTSGSGIDRNGVKLNFNSIIQGQGTRIFPSQAVHHFDCLVCEFI